MYASFLWMHKNAKKTLDIEKLNYCSLQLLPLLVFFFNIENMHLNNEVSSLPTKVSISKASLKARVKWLEMTNVLNPLKGKMFFSQTWLVRLHDF